MARKNVWMEGAIHEFLPVGQGCKLVNGPKYSDNPVGRIVHGYNFIPVRIELWLTPYWCHLTEIMIKLEERSGDCPDVW